MLRCVGGCIGAGDEEEPAVEPAVEPLDVDLESSIVFFEKVYTAGDAFFPVAAHSSIEEAGGGADVWLVNEELFLIRVLAGDDCDGP